MPTLFPPEYPDRPDAPLLSFGPSFSEEIARSLIQTFWRDENEEPHDFEIRVAAGLTMLEAFHPRDHLECMLAAQGVAFHCAIMENLRRAMLANQPELVAIKLRSNASQMGRTFSTILHDMERRQAKPLPERPGQAPIPPTSGPSTSGGPPDESSDPGPPPKRSRAKGSPSKDSGAPVPDKDNPPAGRTLNLDDVPELPEDMEIRPDGTPGSLAGYVPKPPVVEFVPREPAIMIALATRPKPWRLVNIPSDQTPPGTGWDPPPPPDAPASEHEPQPGRGPLDLRERIFTGDSLARFASARFDPDAPIEPLQFEDEDSVVELELISTGGDPAAEAERDAMMAAHPEGKPIVIFRHGTKRPPDGPPDPQSDENPPDT
jgi:hypothetical protein